MTLMPAFQRFPTGVERVDDENWHRLTGDCIILDFVRWVCQVVAPLPSSRAQTPTKLHSKSEWL